MTPLQIEIGLHYYCRRDDFPRLQAPACREVVDAFLAAGLLERASGERIYRPTDGLTVWVEALLAVPWPTQSWSIRRE